MRTAAALLALLSCGPVRAADWDARIVGVSGRATVFAAGAPEGAPAEADSPLEPGDRVETGPDGRVEIALGPENLLRLEPGSVFLVRGIDELDTVLELSVGSLLAKVAKLLEHATIRVGTPQAVAAVRGTEFAVESAEAGTSVGVFDEGRVSVLSSEGGAAAPETFVGPGQEATLAPGHRGPIAVGALRRLAARRAHMRNLLQRRAFFKSRWKAMDPARRRALRQRLLERRRGAIEQRKDRIQRRRPPPRRRERGRP